MPQDDQCFQNVAGVLCCHCWMFSLSDALPMQSCPSDVSCGTLSVRHGLFVWFPADLCFCLRSVVCCGWHFEVVDFMVVECSVY